MSERDIRIGVEVTARRAFASALDWPGWARSDKTADQAVEALLRYGERYEPIARQAGQAFPSGNLHGQVVETLDGDATTAFGAPSVTFDLDRLAATNAEARRIAALVEAAWASFDRTVAAAPVELRKGPRGGGRDTPKILDHVVGAEQAYARQIRVRLPAPEATDRRAVRSMRDAIVAVLRLPSDGAPLGKWTQRYAARRIAWHALDHAWEIEDRSRPEG